MRRTFKGWLLRYCNGLTGLHTTSLKKLCAAVEYRASQASEAVFLYALECGRAHELKTIVKDAELLQQWEEAGQLAAEYEGRAEEFLRERGEALPIRFRNVLNAYDGIEASARNDDYVVSLMAEKTMAALKRAGCTRYRLCKDLSLNSGNIYAWLAGDSTKVSRATARRAWTYAEALDPK